MKPLRLLAPLAALAMLAGCATAPGVAGSTSNAKLVQGPPISDITTPFDEALVCLKGKISPNLVFSVGAVVDLTGKESFTDGGVGKFVTQGAGDMVQSALFKAGTTLVNRRDPRVMTTEVEWQIRSPLQQLPSNFYVTGSINSLDFIPGSGAEVDVAGVGGRYRQNRMLIGLDLAMTEASTGRIVANVPLHKQIFQSEAGIGLGRFFDDTLVSADLGGREREAIHFALRQMLNLATFELLAQLMKAENFSECKAHIDRGHGYVDHTRTAEAVAALEKAKAQPAPLPAPASTPAPAGTRRAAASMSASTPSPAAPKDEKAFQGSTGSFEASNGGSESSAEAKAQAILSQ